MPDDQAKKIEDPKKAELKEVAPKKETKAATTESPAKPRKKGKSKRRSVPEGSIYIHAGYNNTIVTITEPNGNVIAWSTAGASGFKGARKSTPYAAQIAAENAAEKAKVYGFEKADIFVKGAGPGREQSIRGLVSAGINLKSITDITPIPHNGCRKKRPRRV